MKSVIFFFSQLIDQDLDWVHGAGAVEHLPAGTVLVQQGSEFKNLAIVIDGKFSVTIGDVTVATLDSGELIGEISFLDSRPPSASVTALQDSVILAISKATVLNRLQSDPRFASRFYRSIGVLLAHRVRDANIARNTAAAGGESRDGEEIGECSPEFFDALNISGARFDSLRQRILQI